LPEARKTGTLPPGKGYSSGVRSIAFAIFSSGAGWLAAATGSLAGSPRAIIEGPSFAVMGSGVTKDDAEAAPVVRNVAKTSPANIRVKKNCPAKLPSVSG
jgi:hypothetical protein